MQRKVPVSITLMSKFHLSSWKSVIGATRWRPALFTRILIRLNDFTVLSVSFLQSTRFDTSVFTKRESLPIFKIVLNAFSPPFSSMSAMTILAPSFASACAIAKPMPLAAPVTMLTLPLSFVFNSLIYYFWITKSHTTYIGISYTKNKSLQKWNLVRSDWNRRWSMAIS